MYKVFIDKKVEKLLNSFSKNDRARIARVVKLFEERGFSLSEIYLKKLSKIIWELRPGRIRLLFGTIGNIAVLVNVFVKKTARTPKNEILKAENRLMTYEK